MKPFILFDAHGTLCELDDFAGRLKRGFARLGHDVPLSDVKLAARAEVSHYLANALRARDFGSWIAVRRECARVMMGAFRERGYNLSVSLNEAAKTLGAAAQFKLYPDTQATLEVLRSRGYPMATLSNWDYRLPIALKRLGIRDFFGFTMSSAQCGVAKPDPRVFHRALEAARAMRPDLNLAPRDCVYIGDSWEQDIVGAQQAGMRALWLVRDKPGVAPSDETPGEATARGLVRRLRDLSELPAILESL